jgi:Na+-driven multidrug efflux pump
MKAPWQVRIIAWLFGIAALVAGFAWTALFIKEAARQPFPMQVIWVILGLMVFLAPMKLAIGLLRGSKDARIAALAVCWLAFIGVPVSLLAGYRGVTFTDLAIQLAEVALAYAIYQALTFPPIRNGFFGIAKAG